jgi:membrane-bound lytic murein transglycosylase D
LKFEGLPLELMIIPFIETGYNNEVVIDPKKAGLWQLTEELAKNYNLEIDEYIDERKDFERATTAAVLELKRLNNKMNDWNLTIMAWAFGEKEIIKLVNEYRTRDCWKLYELGAFGNSKKKAFLAHFYALLDIIVNAEYYGFKPPRFVKGIPYFRVIINKAVELKRMEQDLRLVDDILYAYNPQLKLRMTPPNYKNFLLKFPADQSLKREFEVQASIYNNMPDNVVKYEPKQNKMEKAGVIEGEAPNELLGFQTEYKDYKVEKNKNLDIDTPYSEEELEEEIVENYKNEYSFDEERAVTSSEDYSYNINIKNADSKKTSKKDIKKQSNDDIEYGEGEYTIDYDFCETEKITTQTKKSDDDIIYKIKYGDTLWGLYKRFGIPYQVIAYYNGIKNPDIIYADDVIKIPSEKKIDNLIAEMESNKNRLSKNAVGSINNNKSSKTIKDVDALYEEEKIDADYNISDSEIGYLIYVVRKGDTLISIANKFNITIKQISVSNPDLSIKILPGQKIRIPLFS